MSPTVVALPRLIELKSYYSHNYMRYVKEGGEVKGLVDFLGDNVANADAKFEVHSSKNGNGLVHIRSCYNNKYLALDEEYNWIVAKAEKPEEDHSKRSCTLLRPTSVDEKPKEIRLTNVHLETYLCSWAAEKPQGSCILANDSDPHPNYRDVFTVIDWQSLVLLPKYVAFQGDNGKFLSAKFLEWHPYLQFSADNVKDDPKSVGNEILPTPWGDIYLRNMSFDRYWRLSPNWIWADTTFAPRNFETLFEPVKYSDDSIALRNARNKLFCTRLTFEGKESCLNACSDTINRVATFKVVELVLSRKIENINFRLMDARIYGESTTAMVSSSSINQGSTDQEQTFELTYIDKKTSTWESSVSMKVSVETTFKAGMPLIAEGEVTMGLEIGGEHKWGETREEEQKISTTFKVSVPPKTKVTVRIMATRGTCDVPFSYTQRDVLFSGETVSTVKDDGVYTGVNNYSYYTEVKEQALDKDPKIASAGFKKVANVSPSGVIIPL